MDEDARRRVAKSRDKQGATRQATRQNVDTVSATPLVSATHPAGVPINPDTDPVEKRKNDAESEGARVKRKVEINLGEALQIIPFINSSADLIDARARVIQVSAK